MAINSPLLDYSIDGARGVLISIRGSSSLTMAEISEAVEVVRQYVDEEANIKFGVIFDDSLGDTIIVTVLATGFAIDPIDAESQHRKRLEPAPQVQQNTRNTVDMISGMSSNNNNSTRPSTQQNQNNFNNRPQQTAPQSKPSNNSNQNQGNNNDDDLDIPAFIRRRQSR